MDLPEEHQGGIIFVSYKLLLKLSHVFLCAFLIITVIKSYSEALVRITSNDVYFISRPNKNTIFPKISRLFFCFVCGNGSNYAFYQCNVKDYYCFSMQFVLVLFYEFI